MGALLRIEEVRSSTTVIHIPKTTLGVCSCFSRRKKKKKKHKRAKCVEPVEAPEIATIEEERAQTTITTSKMHQVDHSAQQIPTIESASDQPQPLNSESGPR